MLFAYRVFSLFLNKIFKYLFREEIDYVLESDSDTDSDCELEG